MKLFRFKDTVDGGIAIILAPNSEAAVKTLNKLTSIQYKLVSVKNIKPTGTSVLFNSILPF